MKKVQKFLTLLMTGVLIAGMLTGCGKADPDPNSGVYEGVKATMMGMTMDVSEVYENGVTFDLQDGGKCVCNLDGETVKLKWSTEGNRIHIEGGGVELDGTVGNGDMFIENMMDMGMDLELHCDELLHPELGGAEGSSDNDALSGSVLQRLKDAKEGKDVYGTSSSSGGDSDEVSAGSGDEESEGFTVDGDKLSGEFFLNPEYESVTGDKFEGGGISIIVPDGWSAFEMDEDSVRVIKGGSSKDDYMSNASILIEWHGDSTGTLDSGNMEEPIEFAGLKLGDHNYNGVYGTVPGDWTSYMMTDEYEDGYLFVTLSLPPDSDVYILDADVQAIMASAEV